MPVIDQTGLGGRYDVTINAAKYIPQSGDRPSDPLSLIQEALQKELGLKLEARKMPVDLLVVGHLQRLTPPGTPATSRENGERNNIPIRKSSRIIDAVTSPDAAVTGRELNTEWRERHTPSSGRWPPAGFLRAFVGVAMVLPVTRLRCLIQAPGEADAGAGLAAA